MGVNTDLGILAATGTETQLLPRLSLEVVWVLCSALHVGKARIPGFNTENNFSVSRYEAELEFIKHRQDSAEESVKHRGMHVGFSKMSWTRHENWQIDFGGSQVTLCRVQSVQQGLRAREFSVVNKLVKYVYEGYCVDLGIRGEH